MKKAMLVMIGLFLITGCSKDNENKDPIAEEIKETKISLLGKWKLDKIIYNEVGEINLSPCVLTSTWTFKDGNLTIVHNSEDATGCSSETFQCQYKINSSSDLSTLSFSFPNAPPSASNTLNEDKYMILELTPSSLIVKKYGFRETNGDQVIRDVTFTGTKIKTYYYKKI